MQRSHFDDTVETPQWGVSSIIMYKILLFGPQGAGKGTQAERLAKRLGLPAMSMGQLLREAQKKLVGTELGALIEDITTNGGLVPDHVALDVLKVRLQEPDAVNGYIIDGYPRNMEQHKAYIAFDQPTHVFMIELSDEEAVKRLAGRRTCKDCGKIYHLDFDRPKVEGVCDVCGGELIQRVDDRPEAIAKRLGIYHNETEPMAVEFEKMGVLHRVDGRGSMDEVEASIKSIINP